MKQITKKNINKLYLNKKTGKSPTKKIKIGTSKLEVDFATIFLDKLKVKYVRQFKAESIGRYYDFYLPDVRLLIEVDGDYYHAKGLTYEQMSPMQKKNTRVDRLKDEWAICNGYPLIRITESDIRKNPSKVTKLLKETVGKASFEKNRVKNRKNP